MIDINIVSELFDTAFSLLGKYGRWLNVKGKRWCFVIWSVCCMYWVYRDLMVGLYSQAFFCITSIGLHMYGFFNWKKERFGEK